MCTYICAGKNKAQNSTSFQTLNQFVGLSENNDAARCVFHFVISRGNEQDWGSPCLSLVPHVPICWLCNTFWEGILRVNMFNIMLISSLELSGLQRDAFRRALFIFSDLLPGNPCLAVSFSASSSLLSSNTKLVKLYIYVIIQ